MADLLQIARPLLVIGSAGQVGAALLAVAGPRAVGVHRRADPCCAVTFDLEAAADDARSTEALLAAIRPRAVLIAAGFTHVDACEEDPLRADRVNARGPAAVARAANALGIRTVYFSTEYVFDGTRGPYTEQDAPCPLSVYGRSKLLGEELVLSADPQALIVRTTVVYGPERQGKNFACRLLEHLRSARRIQVPADQVSTPTYNVDLATATLELLQAGACGIFHVAGPERLDRAAFAVRLAMSCGGDPALIEPVSTISLRQRAARPLNAGLCCDRWRTLCPKGDCRGVEQAVTHWQQQNPQLKWVA